MSTIEGTVDGNKRGKQEVEGRKRPIEECSRVDARPAIEKDQTETKERVRQSIPRHQTSQRDVEEGKHLEVQNCKDSIRQNRSEALTC